MLTLYIYVSMNGAICIHNLFQSPQLVAYFAVALTLRLLISFYAQMKIIDF